MPQVDVLRHVALAQQPGEIERHKLAVADEKTVAQVGEILGVAKRPRRGDAARVGNGLDDRGGRFERVSARLFQPAQHPRARGGGLTQNDRDLRAAVVRGQLFFQRGLHFRHGHAGHFEAAYGVKIQHAVRQHGAAHVGLGKLHHLDLQPVAGAEPVLLRRRLQPFTRDTAGQFHFGKFRAPRGGVRAGLELRPHRRAAREREQGGQQKRAPHRSSSARARPVTVCGSSGAVMTSGRLRFAHELAAPWKKVVTARSTISSANSHGLWFT